MSRKQTEINRLNNSRAVSRDNFADANTGEIANKGIRVYEVSKSDMVDITYGDFVGIPSDYIEMLFDSLSPTNFSRFVLLTTTLKGRFNIIMNKNNTPMGVEQMMTFLGIKSKGTMHSFLNTLFERNILATRGVNVNGLKLRYFHINPFIAKKRKTVSSQLIDIFESGEWTDLKDSDIYLDLDELIDADMFMGLSADDRNEFLNDFMLEKK